MTLRPLLSLCLVSLLAAPAVAMAAAPNGGPHIRVIDGTVTLLGQDTYEVRAGETLTLEIDDTDDYWVFVGRIQPDGSSVAWDRNRDDTGSTATFSDVTDEIQNVVYVVEKANAATGPVYGPVVVVKPKG